MNKYKPHIVVLCEDDANRQIANGFVDYEASLDRRAIQILPPVGGWQHVPDSFEKNHLPTMMANQNRLMILIIDFDKDWVERMKKARDVIKPSR